MKVVFAFVLLLIVASGGLMGTAIVIRFINNMTQTPKIVPGERVFTMPANTVPRGGTLFIPREQREVAAKQVNPFKPTPESIAVGKARFTVYCVPCHGPEGKGGVSGLVAAKFIPTPDLTDPQLQRARTDGYLHSYIEAGGAVMPAYGEAISSDETWDIVNYLRSIVAR